MYVFYLTHEASHNNQFLYYGERGRKEGAGAENWKRDVFKNG